MEKIIIYGSKEFAEIVRNLVGICGHSFIGYIDDLEPNRDFVLGTFEDVKKNYSPNEYKIVNGVGYKNLSARWSIQKKLIENGYKTINLIHPRAIIDKTSKLGEGLIIMAGAIIEMRAQLHDLVVLWPGSIVNHDSEIMANCFLSPNSNICGFVIIGSNCFIGASSTVVNNIIVPANTFIKAGRVYSSKEKVENAV
jgi:UDP-N-acetylbacillosamine N-acetyltransferase